MHHLSEGDEDVARGALAGIEAPRLGVEEVQGVVTQAQTTRFKLKASFSALG